MAGLVLLGCIWCSISSQGNWGDAGDAAEGVMDPTLGSTVVTLRVWMCLSLVAMEIKGFGYIRKTRVEDNENELM
jgi:hypothetical protein